MASSPRPDPAPNCADGLDLTGHTLWGSSAEVVPMHMRGWCASLTYEVHYGDGREQTLVCRQDLCAFVLSNGVFTWQSPLGRVIGSPLDR